MNDAITVTGLQEVNRALYSYSQQLGDRVVIAALTQGANLVKRSISGLAPVKTGKLRRGFRVVKSRIHAGKTSTDMIGVYIRLAGAKKATKKKEADAGVFYGRFQNDGWNTHGAKRTVMNTTSRVNRHGTLKFSRGVSKAVLGRGRATLPGKTNVPGKQFFQKGFAASRENAVRLIVQSTEAGADIVARRIGL